MPSELGLSHTKRHAAAFGSLFVIGGVALIVSGSRAVRNAMPFLHSAPTSDLVVGGKNLDIYICNGREECPFYSQSGEDRELISYIMKSLADGNPAAPRVFPYTGSNYTVLELGGLDGKTFSNSWIFEMFLGWRAILFEPSRQSFPKLRANRPNAFSFNMAACEKEKMVTFVESKIFAVSGIKSTMSNDFWRAWHGHNDTTYNVRCGPLAKYLTLLGATRIDVFFLDVEGAELEAIKGVDLHVLTFHYLIIEADGSAPQKQLKIEEILASHGYMKVGRIGQGRNNFFINNRW